MKTIAIFLILLLFAIGVVSALTPAQQTEIDELDRLYQDLEQQGTQYGNILGRHCQEREFWLKDLWGLEEQLEHLSDGFRQMELDEQKIENDLPKMQNELEQAEEHYETEGQWADPDEQRAMRQGMDMLKQAIQQAQKDLNQIKNDKPKTQKEIEDTKKKIDDRKKNEKTKPKRVITYAVKGNKIYACNNHPNCSFPPGSSVKLFYPR